ncbi:MAG: sporulation integral membrane protein YtvI [Epulopiscium sp. Nuni2H_MBin003]|nr:MAG: sporulation integral membrane protein YtvI [Epulopiscium sp. Nuni2H_MBin003]
MNKKIINIILVLLGVYIFIRYILSLFMPFIIAYLFASLLQPIVRVLNNKLHLRRGIATLVSMLTVLSIISSVIVFISIRLYEQIVAFSLSFPIYIKNIEYFFDTIEQRLDELSTIIPIPDSFMTIEGIIQGVLTNLSNLLSEFLSVAYSTIKFVPSSLFVIIIVLISTFFITKDYSLIAKFIKAQLPHNIIIKINSINKNLKSAVAGYIRTQLILMMFTFTICLIGLFVLNRDYVLLSSVSIAIFDAFPILGSGGILITWGVYHLIMGNIALGLGLLSVYGVIVVTRQLLEPRILSGQIGMYALVTVMSIYIGFKIFGSIGLILGPIIAIVIQTMQNLDIIPAFKQVNED